MMVSQDRPMSAERVFRGHSRVRVKREVLNYWHRNQHTLGMGLKEFLTHCRLSGDGRTVTFRQPQ